MNFVIFMSVYLLLMSLVLKYVSLYGMLEVQNIISTLIGWGVGVGVIYWLSGYMYKKRN